jgi:hypothetical protein
MFELRVVGAEEAAVLIGEGWPTRIVTLRAMSGDVVGVISMSSWTTSRLSPMSGIRRPRISNRCSTSPGT